MKDFLLPNEIKTVLNRLDQSGFSAYIVGGCVRDILMDKTPHDYDVTTSALPEEILKVFEGCETYETGRRFGTITVLSGAYHVEITTMRTEKAYFDGRRPSEVAFTKDIAEDASRRDFTINAMAYSLKEGFFDGFGGVNDIESRLIKAVGKAEKRFSEDGLRIMRALRFASCLGFDIEENTAKALLDCAHMLDNIAKERIREELDRLITGENAPAIIGRYFGIFCRIIPELGHTDREKMLYLMRNTPNDRLLRLTALLSQTGEKAQSIMKNLRYSKDDTQNAVGIIQNQGAGLDTDGDLRRMLGRIGYENTKRLIGLTQNDRAAARLERVKNHPHRLKDLAVNGRDLAKLGIKGENIGRVLNELLETVMENPEKNTKEQLIINIKSRLE